MPCELNSRSSHGIFLSTRTKTNGQAHPPQLSEPAFPGEHKGMICNKNKAARNLKKVRTACLVPVVGVEPTRVISTRDFESPSSAIPTHRRIVLNDFYYTGFYG